MARTDSRPTKETSPQPRPTLAKVAAEAGVSLSTASLAFSGAGPVSDATRTRVEEAAARLGYAGPDPMARSLRRGRTGSIGVVISQRLLHAFREQVTVALLDGLAETLGPDGVGLLLLAGGDAADPALIGDAAVDAVVFATCGLDDEPALPRLHRRGVPVIGVEGPHTDDVCLVDIDQAGGSIALTRHLLDHGHVRFGVVSLPRRLDGRRGWLDDDRREVAAYSIGRERLAGVETALGRTTEVWEATGGLTEEGYVAAQAFLDLPEPPTAIIAQSDLLAVGVIQAAYERGLDVPGDLSVVGFDGVETDWLHPAQLTTAVQPMAEKGRVAGAMVRAVLAGEHPPDVELPVKLRIGTTTGPAPG